ncbi:DoxX family protein [Halobacillus naozhouensis]|uniref:DoxX family protein n=1 Tax=Halobacillus naozhouensis TaxID=554880 RepID=A0ABY8IYY9_9BACI|nr:DoxX family protein [Halobacillus naozhouensis]WFT75037.1 DoxX family protein [Halobacillus naozhouensis]
MIARGEIGAIILRLFLGLTFFIHGLAKFQGGIGNTARFFESLGIPGFAAYVIAAIELIGGLAVIVGIATKVISVLFALIMVGAIMQAKFAAGFLGGYELDLALLVISVFIALSNRNIWALDNVIFSKKQS